MFLFTGDSIGHQDSDEDGDGVGDLAGHLKHDHRHGAAARSGFLENERNVNIIFAIILYVHVQFHGSCKASKQIHITRNRTWNPSINNRGNAIFDHNYKRLQ